MHRIGLLVLSVLLATAASETSAQVSSALIFLPWEPESVSESHFSFTGLYDGDVNGTGFDIDLSRFTGSGRVRPTTEDAKWAAGWYVSHLDINTADPVLPERLAEYVVAGGAKLGTWKNWEWGVTAGIGYSGNAPFNDGDAWYAVASLAARTQLDNGALLSVIFDYDGNRNIFPDIPLPGVAYSDQIDPTLRYVIGFPINTVTWLPNDHWTLAGRWIIPFSLTLDAEYKINDQLGVFAGFNSEMSGYWIQGDNAKRRLFFEQDRVEVGARWRPLAKGELIGAIGYAFNQSFERGWDLRDTDNVRDISDEVYFRVAVRFKF